MTNTDKLLMALSEATSGLCDDCLAVRVGFAQRQQANILCRALATSGMLNRDKRRCAGCAKVKYVNRVKPDSVTQLPVAPTPPMVPSAHSGDKPWYWEGNVQASLTRWLNCYNYTVVTTADTASREVGRDVVAIDPDGRELWVSAKGFPEKSRCPQARHWFAGALFDLVLYRSERADVRLALALPAGFPTYHSLLARVGWLKASLPFTVFWVAEDGSVQEE